MTRQRTPTDNELRCVAEQTWLKDCYVQWDADIVRGSEGDGAYVPVVLWIQYNDVPGYERVDYEIED